MRECARCRAGTQPCRTRWLGPGLGLLAYLWLGTVSQTRAEPIIDFNIDPVHGPGAIVAYGGGLVPLVGTGIGVDSVSGLDTPLFPDDTFAVLDGLLSFETGVFLGSLPGVGSRFSGGGSLTITGGVDTDGDTVADFAGTLLTGSFADDVTLAWFSNGFRVAASALADVVLHPDLASLFGVPDALPEGGLNLSFYVPRGVPVDGPFESTRVLSGDVSAVPEVGAATMGALAFGIFGVARMLRRSRRAPPPPPGPVPPRGAARVIPTAATAPFFIALREAAGTPTPPVAARDAA